MRTGSYLSKLVLRPQPTYQLPVLPIEAPIALDSPVLQAPRKLFAFREKHRPESTHCVLLELSLKTGPVVVGEVDGLVVHLGGLEVVVVEGAVAVELAEFE